MNSDKCNCPGCGDLMEYFDLIRVYDDHGIYAGRYCCYECAENSINLHYSRQDAAENGENIDLDY